MDIISKNDIENEIDKYLKEEKVIMEKNEEKIDETNGGVESGVLQCFIERLITDEEFKNGFVENPDEAMKDYDLTESQKLLMKTLDKEDIMKLSPENQSPL